MQWRMGRKWRCSLKIQRRKETKVRYQLEIREEWESKKSATCRGEVEKLEEVSKHYHKGVEDHFWMEIVLVMSIIILLKRYWMEVSRFLVAYSQRFYHKKKKFLSNAISCRQHTDSLQWVVSLGCVDGSSNLYDLVYSGIFSSLQVQLTQVYKTKIEDDEGNKVLFFEVPAV